MATLLQSLAAVGLLCCSFTPSNENAEKVLPFTGKTVVLKSTDKLNIKADIYEASDKHAPVILLFHQAGYSRGEYRPIAPKLNQLGFTCIAIDQRSGKEVNGVVNEANSMAKQLGLQTAYADAMPDLETALSYAQKQYPSRKIIIWGSSYSAALSLVLTSKHPESISALITFSPGEYFKFDGKEIAAYAKLIRCPVLITSAKNEYESWKTIYEAIPSKGKQSFVPQGDGVHGSKALWEANANNQEYWSAVKKFLDEVKNHVIL